MQRTVSLRGPAFLIAGMCLALFMVSGVASADDDKCVNTANKKIAKVAKAMSGDIAKCIKDGGNNKLTTSIEECITSDPKGKVAKACDKAEEKINKDCPTPPAVPPIDTNDPNALCQIMIDKELRMIHAIFGTDLDVAVFMKDPDKDEWKCQSAVAKAADKCQIAKLDTFNACKKNLLKAGDPDVGTLQDACMGTNSPPNHGIPDVKGKIGKKCGNGLGGTLGKKCAGLDTDALFPPCAGQDLAQCIDQKIECEVCLALNALDGLSRNCDEFDDGSNNGSCGPPRCGDGILDPNEACEWNNLNGEDCESLGFLGGVLDCSPGLCTFDTSGCYIGKQVFVTSTRTNGAFGGLAVGDAICAARAAAAGLSGTFLAWLGDGVDSPATRFSQSVIPYRRTDGVAIANDWSDLIDGSLLAPIEYDEFGTRMQTAPWTGVDNDGTTALDHCNAWSLGSGGWGIMGQSASTGVWSCCSGSVCEFERALFCFEQ